jgi:hypothetical protein
MASANEVQQFSQTPIHRDDWTKFVEYTPEHFLGNDASDLTQCQKDFMQTKIMTGDEIMEELKYTMRIFRDVITYELRMPNPGDYHNFDDSTCEERMEVLRNSFVRALVEFRHLQTQVEGPLTEERQVFVDMEMSADI